MVWRHYNFSYATLADDKYKYVLQNMLQKEGE
jgi:hypothetical protein